MSNVYKPAMVLFDRAEIFAKINDQKLWCQKRLEDYPKTSPMYERFLGRIDGLEWMENILIHKICDHFIVSEYTSKVVEAPTVLFGNSKQLEEENGTSDISDREGEAKDDR